MRLLRILCLAFALALAGGWPVWAQFKIGETITATIESPHPLENGLWRQEVEFPRATFIKLHAASIELGADDVLNVFDGQGRQAYSLAGPQCESRWLPLIGGDRVTLEIRPAEGSRPWGVLIDKVGRGFAPLSTEGIPMPESICGQNDMKDPACYASDTGKIAAGDAVAWIEIAGVIECTGFLVSPQAHFLTCNHCITSESDAQSIDVQWRFQLPACGSGTPSVERTTSGSHLVKTSTDYDYSLVLLTFSGQNPASQYGYLPLNPTPNQVGDTIWIPQHPEGGPKKFTVVSDMDGGGPPKIQAVDVNGFSTQPPGTDIAYYADTMGGSSGSPVLNLQNQVVALHHAGTGSAPCTPQFMNQGVEMKLIYPEITDCLGGGGLAAQASAQNTSGQVPLTVYFMVTATCGTPPYTYDWDFGDGTAHSNLSDPTHTYTAIGSYQPAVTVHDNAGATAVGDVTIRATGPPPTISAVGKLANPFRLKVTGTNFQQGAQVFIGGAKVPDTTYKSPTQLVAKKGAPLKNMVPKGQSVSITVENPDGGVSAPFTYTR